MIISKLINALRTGYTNLFLEKGLNEPQKNYILSGFSNELLENYKIIYSPHYVQLSLNKNGTILKKIKNNLEEKLDDFKLDLFLKKGKTKSEMVKYYKNLKNKLKETHKRNMEKIRINHLRNMNKICSNFLENYMGKQGFEKISIRHFPEGGLSFKFK